MINYDTIRSQFNEFYFNFWMIINNETKNTYYSFRTLTEWISLNFIGNFGERGQGPSGRLSISCSSSTFPFLYFFLPYKKDFSTLYGMGSSSCIGVGTSWKIPISIYTITCLLIQRLYFRKADTRKEMLTSLIEEFYLFICYSGSIYFTEPKLSKKKIINAVSCVKKKNSEEKNNDTHCQKQDWYLKHNNMKWK